MSDAVFMAQVLRNLDELRALIVDKKRRWSTRALDVVASEVAAVGIRFLRNRKCAGPHCESDAVVEPISTESFCSAFCRGASLTHEIDTAARIDEAMSQYVKEDQNVGN